MQRPAAPPLSVGRGDIVRLKSGGIVRGTIDEKLPGEHVIVTTPLGTTRRFEWKDIQYAGPAGDIDTKVIDLDASNEIESEGDPSSNVEDAAPNSEHKSETTTAATTDESKKVLPRETSQSASPSQTHAEDSGAAAALPIAAGVTSALLLGVAVVGAIRWSRDEGKLSALCGTDKNCHDGRPYTLTIEQENEVISLVRDRKIYRTLTVVSGTVGLGALIFASSLLLSTNTKSAAKTSGWSLEPGPANTNRGGVTLRFRF